MRNNKPCSSIGAYNKRRRSKAKRKKKKHDLYNINGNQRLSLCFSLVISGQIYTTLDIGTTFPLNREK
jgi:hypothetical protein